MSGPGVAHRLGEPVGQSARVAERDAGEQGGPLRRQAPRERGLGRQARPLRPRPGQGTRGYRGRNGHLPRVEHPAAARRLERGFLVEIAGVPRPPGQPQLPLHDRRASLLEVGDPAPLRQPDLRALGPGRRGEGQPRAPAPPRLPHRRVERPRDPYRAFIRRLPPAFVAGGREMTRAARGQDGQGPGDHGPEQRTAQDPHPFIRSTPRKSSLDSESPAALTWRHFELMLRP